MQCSSCFRIPFQTAHLHGRIAVSRLRFDSIAADLSTLDPATILHAVSYFEKHGSSAFGADLPDDVRKALLLIGQVKSVSASIPGSESARSKARNEIRGYSAALGVPHIYMTLNVSAVHSTVFQLMCGKTGFTIDTRFPSHGAGLERTIRLVNNPVLAARFFDFMIEACFAALFGWDFVSQRSTEKGGVFGKLSG